MAGAADGGARIAGEAFGIGGRRADMSLTRATVSASGSTSSSRRRWAASSRARDRAASRPRCRASRPISRRWVDLLGVVEPEQALRDRDGFAAGPGGVGMLRGLQQDRRCRFVDLVSHACEPLRKPSLGHVEAVKECAGILRRGSLDEGRVLGRLRSEQVAGIDADRGRGQPDQIALDGEAGTRPVRRSLAGGPRGLGEGSDAHCGPACHPRAGRPAAHASRHSRAAWPDRRAAHGASVTGY